MQLETNQGHALVLVNDLNEVGLRHAIVKLDAFLQGPNQCLIGLTQHGGEIRLRNFELRVHQTVDQFTIISQNKQTIGVSVDTADIEAALSRCGLLCDHIAHAGTTHVILHGRLHAARLIQNEVLVVFIDVDANPVNADDIHIRVHADALPLDDFAVNFNSTSVDEYLCVTAGSNTSLSEYFL